VPRAPRRYAAEPEADPNPTRIVRHGTQAQQHPPLLPFRAHPTSIVVPGTSAPRRRTPGHGRCVGWHSGRAQRNASNGIFYAALAMRAKQSAT
jgi:hypothetical protein